MIYRLRKHKRRWGISVGRAFTGYHFGKRSWYIAHSRRMAQITIKDWEGLVEVHSK